MFRIDMHVGDVRELNRELGELPFDLADEFATEIGKSARIRAKEWTGQMKTMIQVEAGKKKIKKIQNLAPYAIYQERGFTPHWVHMDMPTGSGLTIKDWFQSKYPQAYANFVSKGKEFIWVGARGQGKGGSYQPFMIPAVESIMQRFPQIAERITRRRIEQGLRTFKG